MKIKIVAFYDDDRLKSLRDFPNDEEVERNCVGHSLQFRSGFLACIDFLTSHCKVEED